jgi:hypothetical protein
MQLVFRGRHMVPIDMSLKQIFLVLLLVFSGPVIAQPLPSPATDAARNTLSDNYPYNRGIYMFSDKMVFDFKRGSVEGFGTKKFMDQPPFPGEAVYGVETLSDCSNTEYYCFKSPATSLIWPKKCGRFRNEKSFAYNGITTRIIRAEKTDSWLSIHTPFALRSDIYYLSNPAFPAIVYEYAIGYDTASIVAVRFDRYGQLNMEQSVRDDTRLTLDWEKREEAIRKNPTNVGYEIEKWRGPDVFGECARTTS